MGDPRQEECLCLTIHVTLHLYILDIIDSVDSHQCNAQSFHSCQENCAARWTQIHGKHFVFVFFFFVFFFFSVFFLFFVFFRFFFQLFSFFIFFHFFRLFFCLPTLYAVFWSFSLLMKLHDFVAKPVNPVDSFYDAYTVPFCLTADHIATCDMSLCPHQASTVLVCFWTCYVWKSVRYLRRRDWVSWSPTRLVKRLSHSWSPTRVLIRGHSSGSGGMISHSWSVTRSLDQVKYLF